MSDEHSEIAETLESIREKEFPDLSSDLVNKIVEAEYETLENRGESQSQISTHIESYLEDHNDNNVDD